MLSARIFGGDHPRESKRFSMNYQDFLNGQQSEVTPKDKRFSMNMRDLMRRQERLKLEKKRFTMNFQGSFNI